MDLGNTLEAALNLPSDKELLCDEERERIVSQAVESMLEYFRLTPDLLDRELFTHEDAKDKDLFEFLKYVPRPVKGNVQKDR